MNPLFPQQPSLKVEDQFRPDADCVLYLGDCLKLLRQIPDKSARLIVTSPPYNIGKEYERKIDLEKYLSQQEQVIRESIRILADDGSICWQVGNFVEDNEVLPLDIALYPIFGKLGLKLRNRIIWHFEHGLHGTKRLSGRYETILWFTKPGHYVFDLDQIRVPQKYPFKKHYKGPNRGQLSGHPLGKNPGDVWVIPNVKHNHVEKTIHPCQFPVELVERLVLSMTRPGDLVVDPFMGVGTTAVAAILHRRKAAGADIIGKYIEIARNRVEKAAKGILQTRPMDRPVYDHTNRNSRNHLVLQMERLL
jgi:adenine-specific DNA-methyltransferase